MSDVIIQAQQARTQLAKALNALQSDDVPLPLQDVAAIVAQAMSLLHRIETKGEQAPTAKEALTLLRAALNQLQAPENSHPRGDAALEVVASSLGVVHQLTQSFGAQQPPAPRAKATAPAAAQTAATAAAVPSPAIQAPAIQAPAVPVPAAPARAVQGPAVPAPGAAPPGAKLAVADAAFLAPTPVAPPPKEAFTPAPPTARADQAPETPLATAATQAVLREDIAVAEPQPGPQMPKPSLASASQEEPIPLSRVSSPPTLPSAPPAAPERPSDNPAQRISNNPGALPALAAHPGETFVEAALGAYSTTNFYKGLSGNDVIDAGGLFIATYAPPEMGQQVRVNVSLPGGFEFQARGVVTWVREMPKSGSLNPMSPPGYGVRFTEISKEARQLVYRYVRNREPLFYDDI
jgi:uncharacterized protein (TIGR02266 family)